MLRGHFPARRMNKTLRCYGTARDARLKGRADLCGTAANPDEGDREVSE